MRCAARRLPPVPRVRATLESGLADCVLVVLAGRWRTTRSRTFDERRLRAVAPPHGEAFTILAARAAIR